MLLCPVATAFCCCFVSVSAVDFTVRTEESTSCCRHYWSPCNVRSSASSAGTSTAVLAARFEKPLPNLRLPCLASSHPQKKNLSVVRSRLVLLVARNVQLSGLFETVTVKHQLTVGSFDCVACMRIASKARGCGRSKQIKSFTGEGSATAWSGGIAPNSRAILACLSSAIIFKSIFLRPRQ